MCPMKCRKHQGWAYGSLRSACHGHLLLHSPVCSGASLSSPRSPPAPLGRPPLRIMPISPQREPPRTGLCHGSRAVTVFINCLPGGPDLRSRSLRQPLSGNACRLALSWRSITLLWLNLDLRQHLRGKPLNPVLGRRNHLCICRGS